MSVKNLEKNTWYWYKWHESDEWDSMRVDGAGKIIIHHEYVTKKECTGMTVRKAIMPEGASWLSKRTQ
jgi:hypothetical protein